jgi:DNA-binding CsgD family transcriptional regulator
MQRRDPEPGMPLSKQELAVLTAIAGHGSDGDTIAAILNIPPFAIKTHKHNIARKLGVSGRCTRTAAASVAVGFRTGLLNTLPPFAAPTEEYRLARAANPYVIRHDNGTPETINTWRSPETGGKP